MELSRSCAVWKDRLKVLTDDGVFVDGFHIGFTDSLVLLTLEGTRENGTERVQSAFVMSVVVSGIYKYNSTSYQRRFTSLIPTSVSGTTTINYRSQTIPKTAVRL
jgi:hypothetical protein